MRKLRAKALSLRAIRDRVADNGVKVSHVAVGNALKSRERNRDDHAGGVQILGVKVSPAGCGRVFLTPKDLRRLVGRAMEQEDTAAIGREVVGSG